MKREHAVELGAAVEILGEVAAHAGKRGIADRRDDVRARRPRRAG